MKRRKFKRTRFLVIGILISVIFIGLIVRVSYLIVFNGSHYKVLALQQWTRTIDLNPKRGKILDRNGKELALSIDVYRVDADLKVLRKYLDNKKISEDLAVDKISKLLGVEQSKLRNILNSTDKNGNPLQFVSLKRKVEKSVVDALKKLNYSGIIISEDEERVYPNNNLLSHVIGHTNSQGNGITGVELTYNKALKGIAGVEEIETDKNNDALPFTQSVVVKPIDGKDLTLTTDERIQELAQTVAEDTLRINSAKSVSITVMDPKTGEVLAMVNTPSYDLNNPYSVGNSNKEIEEMWKNRAISNIFEPGSILKVMTAAAALQNNVVKDDDRFECKGSIKVTDSTTLHCDNNDAHGIQDFSEIMKNSCNVGFIELGQKLRKENLYNFDRLAGFGQKTGIDLPGESQGILKSLKNMGTEDAATLTYGQGVAITQIQYLAAFSAIANNGVWIRPHVMKQISHITDGKTVIDERYNNLGKRTIMNAENAAKLRTVLEKVVDDPTGTGHSTYIQGYRIAGKTGTANEINSVGGYGDKYVSSFAGMAPANDPKVTLIITVNEPDSNKYYAAQTAVPAAKKLFAGLFPLLNINADNSAEENN